ncbi:MAG: hypothetical protein H8D78_12910 [Chloroflexi bacterium]|nr:hypothetical protein [Chloroflexota bacterium]
MRTAPLVRLIDEHLARHPAMEPRDVYKLLYQGVLGPQHLIASPEEFTERLRAEYETVPPWAAEPLWEPVRPDRTLGRLNLRPFKVRGGDVEELIAACLETAQQAWGTPEELQVAWAAFVELCRAGRWGVFLLPEVLAFSAWLEEHGYPIVHHSACYREADKPAYRLVGRESLSYLKTREVKDV